MRCVMKRLLLCAENKWRAVAARAVNVKAFKSPFILYTGFVWFDVRPSSFAY